MMAMSGISQARVTGTCSECHTMHNSQGGQPLAYGLKSDFSMFELDAIPNPTLLITDCIGCHTNIESSDTIVDGVPIVFNASNVPDNPLAGGNFKYVVTGDDKGHNVAGIIGLDGALGLTPPGGGAMTGQLRCAGQYGCHGKRDIGDELAAIRNAHHADDSMLKFGSINESSQTADVGTSYRFLHLVKGGEDGDWQDTAVGDDHNEYKGATSMGESSPTIPAGNTMSGLCAECHGYFHGTGADEAGDESPWLRHPTDRSLPATGEYLLFTTYNFLVPVARVKIPDSPSSEVDPTSTDDDIVMCLSCHRAHASPYFKIMRWDYQAWPPGGDGCHTCHTSKN